MYAEHEDGVEGNPSIGLAIPRVRDEAETPECVCGRAERSFSWDCLLRGFRMVVIKDKWKRQARIDRRRGSHCEQWAVWFVTSLHSSFTWLERLQPLYRIMRVNHMTSHGPQSTDHRLWITSSLPPHLVSHFYDSYIHDVEPTETIIPRSDLTREPWAH